MVDVSMPWFRVPPSAPAMTLTYAYYMLVKIYNNTKNKTFTLKMFWFSEVSLALMFTEISHYLKTSERQIIFTILSIKVIR